MMHKSGQSTPAGNLPLVDSMEDYVRIEDMDTLNPQLSLKENRDLLCNYWKSF